jgi:hypothetical protein
MTTGMLSAAVWSALGVAIALGGLGLGFGTWATPASGFVPTLAGVALAAIGAAVFYQERQLARVAPGGRAEPGPSPSDRWRVAAAVAAILAYGLLLPVLGLVLTTSLVLAVLFRFVGGLGWLVTATATVAATVFSYVLFARWLKVPFPPGPWGF